MCTELLVHWGLSLADSCIRYQIFDLRIIGKADKSPTELTEGLFVAVLNLESSDRQHFIKPLRVKEKIATQVQHLNSKPNAPP